MDSAIIGIDPGEKGAVALLGLYTDWQEVYSLKELEIHGLITYLKELHRLKQIKRVFIEKQQAFPGQGVVSMFTAGKNYGIILGILKTLAIPYEEIPAQKWKRIYGLTTKLPKKERKILAIEKAKALFPALREAIGKHDGKAEALLIAEYGRRILGA